MASLYFAGTLVGLASSSIGQNEEIRTLQQQLATAQAQLNEFNFCTAIANRFTCEAEPRCQFDNNCKPV